MTGSQIVTEIVTILASGITQLGQAIGSGISGVVTSMFFQGTGESQTLSVFAVMVIVFAGVGLAIGLTRLVFTWLQSLGN